MACEEWNRLVKQYRLSVHAYSDAVDHFSGRWDPLIQAREKTERACDAVRDHELQHRCGKNVAAAAQSKSAG